MTSEFYNPDWTSWSSELHIINPFNPNAFFEISEKDMYKRCLSINIVEDFQKVCSAWFFDKLLPQAHNVTLMMPDVMTDCQMVES